MNEAFNSIQNNFQKGTFDIWIDVSLFVVYNNNDEDDDDQATLVVHCTHVFGEIKTQEWIPR